MRLEPIIAVDFDGTIAENDYPNVGEALPGALEGLREMKAAGCKLILWTCRHGDNLQAAVDWLVERDAMVFDAINDHSSHDLIPDRSKRGRYTQTYTLMTRAFLRFPDGPNL